MIASRQALKRLLRRGLDRGRASEPGSDTETGTGLRALPPGLSRDLGRILRPQAAYRWLLPQLAAMTPQYLEMVLRGALAGNHVQAWELFDLMEDTSPRLLKNLNELKRAVLGLDWEIVPWQEEDQPPTSSARDKARLVSAALRSLRPEPQADENDLRGTIYDLLDAWGKGQSVLEVDWEIRDAGGSGQIVAPRATYWVHPTCYAWSLEGRLGLRLELSRNLEPGRGSSAPGSLMPGVWQNTTMQPLPSAVGQFPPHKFLISICKAKSGTALGGALLRPLAWWWGAANFSGDWLMKLAQIFGLPLRWANYDAGTPQATIDGICSMLQNMGSSGWAAFPEGTTLDLKEASRTAETSPQRGPAHCRYPGGDHHPPSGVGCGVCPGGGGPFRASMKPELLIFGPSELIGLSRCNTVTPIGRSGSESSAVATSWMAPTCQRSSS